MKVTEGLKYMFLCLLLYLTLGLIEIYGLRPLLDTVTESFFLQTVIYAALMLIVNPILTYVISERLPFAPSGLKVAGGLETALKSEVDISEGNHEDK